MHSFINKTRSLSLAALLIVVTLGCKDELNPVTTTDLNLETTALGRVLTGDGGRTLYVFGADADGNANCSGACLGNWPVYYKETFSLGNGLTAADFTTITRADGAKQTAFKGWPLYYFGPDQGIRDNTKGVSVPRPGVWPVVYKTSPEAPTG